MLSKAKSKGKLGYKCIDSGKSKHKNNKIVVENTRFIESFEKDTVY